jgi:O-antigen ligase
VLAVGLAYRFHLPGWELVRDRFVDQTLAQGYDSGRPAIFSAALRLAWEHPLLGVGIDGFRVLAGDRLGAVYAHNYVLSVAAEGGVIGLGLLTTAVALWIATMRRLRPWSPLARSFVLAAAFIVLASLASGDYYDARLAWCFAGLAAATASVPTDGGPAGQEAR